MDLKKEPKAVKPLRGWSVTDIRFCVNRYMDLFLTSAVLTICLCVIGVGKNPRNPKSLGGGSADSSFCVIWCGFHGTWARRGRGSIRLHVQGNTETRPGEKTCAAQWRRKDAATVTWLIRLRDSANCSFRKKCSFRAWFDACIWINWNFLGHSKMWNPYLSLGLCAVNDQSDFRQN